MTPRPADVVRAEADRRNRARAVGLPLSAPLAQIEARENLPCDHRFAFRRLGLPGAFCSSCNREFPEEVSPTERPTRDRQDDAGLPVTPLPACVCSHDGELHGADKRCTVPGCRCRLYRTREAQHVAAGVKFMTGLGFRHMNYSTTAKSKIHPGHPDHLFLHPVKGLAVYWESKSDDGRTSEAQLAFQVLAEASGLPCVIGRYADLRAWVERTLTTGAHQHGT